MSMAAGLFAAITASAGFLVTNSSDTESDSNDKDRDAVYANKKLKSPMKKSPTHRARKRILAIEKPVEVPKMSFRTLSPRNSQFLIPEYLLDNDNSFKSCSKERQADLEEIERMKRFVKLDMEDPLNKRLASNVVEGSGALLLSIRHGLFLRAYGLISKGCLPYVIFDNCKTMDAADFIAEIVKASDRFQLSESELQITLELISKIYQAAGSEPVVLDKAKAVAKDRMILKYLFEVGGFVSQLYPVAFNSPSSENAR